MIVKCPSCARDNSGGNFCSWCAAPLDGSSVETELIAVASEAPRLTSSTTVDEGRFLPGTVLAGRYRVAGLLGRGGMGEVYRATDLTLGQAVALKFLPEQLGRDERALARFYNEVRIARQVTHPNVCRVYDIGQVEGVQYISMEFVDGEDLASLLRRIGRLPVDKALETARKLCAGLAAAHERGVLHRDLKPANIMIDSRGQVIIMDFGLAGLSEQVQGDVRSGTPAYMSPEQLAGREVTIKSDLYALGLVLYELFTGKRAFEAASLMELMELQQRVAPASLSSTVKDIEPTVERVILRCLSPDPALRPPSALAVSAALPGGDPLAEALAAGETPSPELVAAAGEMEGLPAKVAIGWLGAALAGLVALAVIAPTQEVTSKVGLEAPPEGLAREARTMLRDFGYAMRPGDTGSGFSYDEDYRGYLKQHPEEAAARWKSPGTGEPPVIRFWYRESPQKMAAGRDFNVSIRYDDPPLEMSGMVRLRLDPAGKLRQLEVIPPQVEPPGGAPPFDWNRLFQAAGLEMTQFQPASPEWMPLAGWDQRAAWTRGTLRVEAAAWRGRPVSFRVIGPWSKPERTQQPAGQQVVSIIVVYTALITAGVIAWLNTRARKVDMAGARRLGILFFVSLAAARLLYMHHTFNSFELELFWMAVSNAAINAAAAWVFYLALEPWVRRRWPQTMVSWSRFAIKGVHDPLVGRDLLYGVAVAAIASLLIFGRAAMRQPQEEPVFPSLNAFTGLRYLGGDLLSGLTNAILGTLLLFFILFVLRVVLRKQWIAVLVFTAVFIATSKLDSANLPVQILYLAFFGAVWVTVLLRFGLLATIIADAARSFLTEIPHTSDISAWYGTTLVIPLVLIALVAVYGFRTSLGGRRLIPVPD
ncbi:MAG: hypothetical protein C5B51_21710 [Terriglobia bacterium]|nr:MAG: hypothetical protein C5B51_21710 [Terriglobia bacterium]